MTNLQDLLERVTAATGPDRELDGHIYGALGFQVIKRFGGFEWRPEGKGIWRTMPSPTSSLDAALALCERVLPGWRRMVKEYPEGWFGAVLMPQPNDAGLAGVNTPTLLSTPAIALLAATLRALIAQQSDLVPTGGGKEGSSSSISQSGCTTFGRNETAEPSARGGDRG